MSARKVIVMVATDHYVNGIDRMIAKLEEFDRYPNTGLPRSLFLWWKDRFPDHSPTHAENPYAFKAYALMRAAELGDLLLWTDASICPIRDLGRLWDQIERDGYWIAKNGWTNYEWTADSAYKDLFPGMDIDRARQLNRTFPQVVATSFGLDVRSEIGGECLKRYYELANTDAFKGPWSNTNNPNAWPQAESRMGPCGPPDVLGHRHDQTALSVIAWRLGMKLNECPDILAYPPSGESTILEVRGA